MIIGIVTAYCRQKRDGHHHHKPADLKETLITQEDERNREKENINRTSVDP